MVIAVIVVGIGVLSDGWVDRIRAVRLPPAVPGAASMAGATVLEAPPGSVFRDIQAVFRAVNGGWRTVNGYSGWSPTYYHTLVGAARDEVDGDADAISAVRRSARAGRRRRPASSRADRAAAGRYAGGQRRLVDDVSFAPTSDDDVARAAGERWQPRELRSSCASALLLKAMDQDEMSIWQCAIRDERRHSRSTLARCARWDPS